MNKKERKTNQVLVRAQEAERKRLTRKSTTIKEDLELLRMKKSYDTSREERTCIIRERGIVSQMRVGILTKSVPTNIHSTLQGIIPIGQCILFELVSPISYRIIANDGREGTCWGDALNQMHF